jgi:hypothetical protein
MSDEELERLVDVLVDAIIPCSDEELAKFTVTVDPSCPRHSDDPIFILS